MIVSKIFYCVRRNRSIVGKGSAAGGNNIGSKLTIEDILTRVKPPPPSSIGGASTNANNNNNNIYPSNVNFANFRESLQQTVHGHPVLLQPANFGNSHHLLHSTNTTTRHHQGKIVLLISRTTYPLAAAIISRPFWCLINN